MAAWVYWWQSSERETGARMLTLTETAADKVKELLVQEGRSDIALRVAVQPGGCAPDLQENGFPFFARCALRALV